MKKFRIYRTIPNLIGWQLINFLYPCLLIILSAKMLSSFDIKRMDIMRLSIVLLLVFNIILCSVLNFFRDHVVIKGDILSFHCSYYPSCFRKFNIATVSNVHYCNQVYDNHKIDWEKEGPLFGWLYNRKKTIRFVDHNGWTVQLSTKDHEKLYALLKEREGPGYYDDWGRVSKWK